MMQTLFFATLMSMLVHVPAHALLEVRTHAGLEFNAPDKFNNWLSTQDIKQIYLLPRTGLQAFVTVIPSVALGVVYDQQSIKVNSTNSGDNDAKLSVERFAFKAIYFLVDRGFRTGPALSYGFKHNFNIDGTGVTAGGFKWDKAKGKTASASWEVGGHMGWVVIGGDLGFQWYEYTDIKGPSGDAPFEVNTSGLFLSAFVGLNIL